MTDYKKARNLLKSVVPGFTPLLRASGSVALGSAVWYTNHKTLEAQEHVPAHARFLLHSEDLASNVTSVIRSYQDQVRNYTEHTAAGTTKELGVEAQVSGSPIVSATAAKSRRWNLAFEGCNDFRASLESIDRYISMLCTCIRLPDNISDKKRAKLCIVTEVKEATGVNAELMDGTTISVAVNVLSGAGRLGGKSDSSVAIKQETSQGAFIYAYKYQRVDFISGPSPDGPVIKFFRWLGFGSDYEQIGEDETLYTKPSSSRPTKTAGIMTVSEIHVYDVGIIKDIQDLLDETTSPSEKQALQGLMNRIQIDATVRKELDSLRRDHTQLAMAMGPSLAQELHEKLPTPSTSSITASPSPRKNIQ